MAGCVRSCYANLVADGMDVHNDKLKHTLGIMKIAIKNILLLVIICTTFAACEYEDGDNTPAIMFNPGCALKPVFPYNGGSEDYLFTTSYSWTATPADEWVTITPASGTKEQNTFTITVAPNHLGEDRTSSVEVKLSNGKRATIPITQQMHPVFNADVDKLVTLSAVDALYEIPIQTNQDYRITVSNDAIWLSARVTRSVEDHVLRLTATDNRTTSSRIATVYVISDDSELLTSFVVVQSAQGSALNEVAYYTKTKRKVDIGSSEGFGALFLAHIYDEERGCGRIIFDYLVRAIPAHTFENCREITQFDLPATLTKIGEGAFSGCTGCSEFTLPSQIEILEGGIFNGCKGVLTTDCYIPNEGCATTDPNHWLYGSEFATVYINNSIGSGTFFDYDILERVYLSPEVDNIHNRAFEDCNALKEIHIESVAEWCDITFGGPTANPLNGQQCVLKVDGETVTELQSNGIRYIGQYGFYNYALLNRIVLSDDTTSIGACAFAECDVESITIGKSIVSVGNMAFDGCHTERFIIDGDIKPQTTTGSTSRHWFSGLEAESVIFTEKCSVVGDMLLSDLPMRSVTLASTVKHINNGPFAGCSELSEIDLGTGLISIGDHAFYGCTSLEEIELPESLETISDYTFKDCSGLKSITIPAGVTHIGEYAFSGCSNLGEIRLESMTPPTLGGDYIFDGYGDTLTIYVPVAAVEIYKSAPHWYRYSKQIVGY